MEQDIRNSIVEYITKRADQHDAAALKTNGADVSYHKGTAVLFRALAGDIRAQLDA